MKVSPGPQALPKRFRLLKRAEFRRVYEEGERRSNSTCVVFYRPNGLAHMRVGITTPTRLGRAVVRNRLRRRLREVFRLHRGTLPGGWDVVLNPRPTAAQIPFATLARKLLQLFPAQVPASAKDLSGP
jgi:ribonuclease P protein component